MSPRTKCRRGSFNVQKVQRKMFRVGIKLLGAIRMLHQLGMAYRPTGPYVGYDDREPMEPNADHVAWRVSEAAIIAAEELKDPAKKLIKASRLTLRDFHEIWETRQRAETESRARKR